MYDDLWATSFSLEESIGYLADESDTEAAEYCVEGLLPTGGNALLVAQAKAGKTTLTHNLVRALADGVPFLDRFAVKPDVGRIAVFNNEMHGDTNTRWLRDQGIENVDRIELYSMKGIAHQLDFTDRDCRAAWARKLPEQDIAFVVFDCLRPVLDALGLSEDKDAGRFLVGFDAMLREAGGGDGLSGSVIVHHMGHGGTRARGDSRLVDWADANWTLTTDASGRRLFAASGRDVNLPECLLNYDPATRRFTVSDDCRDPGGGAARLHEILLALNDGLTTRGALARLRSDGATEQDARAAITEAKKIGAVHEKPGPNRSKILTANVGWEAA